MMMIKLVSFGNGLHKMLCYVHLFIVIVDNNRLLITIDVITVISGFDT